MRPFQWPRGLRHESAAIRLLGWRVRIPLEPCMFFVSVVCCQVEVSTSGWSLVQRSPTECSVPECNREASIIRRLWPTRGCHAMKIRRIASTCTSHSPTKQRTSTSFSIPSFNTVHTVNAIPRNNSDLWRWLVKRHDTELDIYIYTHNLTAGILCTTTAQEAIQNTHNDTHSVDQVVKSDK